MILNVDPSVDNRGWSNVSLAVVERLKETHSTKKEFFISMKTTRKSLLLVVRSNLKFDNPEKVAEKIGGCANKSKKIFNETNRQVLSIISFFDILLLNLYKKNSNNFEAKIITWTIVR